MEFSPSKDEILGKRKRNQEGQENKIGELKKVKNKNNEDNLEAGEEDSSKLEQAKEETIRENIDHIVSEESLIANLYGDTLDIIRFKIKFEETDVERAYVEIKEKFKIYQFTKMDFNISENLIAYFYIYSTFNTNLSRNRFLNAFENCQELQETIKEQNLKIISLGGGPGTDMIGFCSALQDFLSQEMDGYSSSIKKLSITVVDVWKRWASFHNVIEFLIREGDYGNVSTIFKSKDVTSSFMMIDLLSQVQPSEYTSDLAAADIVFLVRVLDSFDFRETRPTDLIRNIITGMKSGALLLIIDSVTKEFSNSDVTQVYQSELDEYEMQVQLKKIFAFDARKSSKAGIFVLQKQ